MPLLRTLLALSALALTTHALPVSGSCTAAVGAVLGNSTLSACLSPASLTPLVVNGQIISTSIIPTASSWLNKMCSLPACDINAIAWGINTVVTGCKEDIGPALSGSGVLGGDFSKLLTITTAAPRFYPVARRMACLWESGQNCATKTATAFENFVGVPLSPPNLLATFNELTSGSNSASGAPIHFNFDTAPTSLVCTSCVKAGLNTIRTDFLATALVLRGNIQPHLQDKCGASFIDGRAAVGISNSSTGSTSNNDGNTGGSIGTLFNLRQGVLSGTGLAFLSMMLSIAL